MQEPDFNFLAMHMRPWRRSRTHLKAADLLLAHPRAGDSDGVRGHARIRTASSLLPAMNTTTNVAVNCRDRLRLDTYDKGRMACRVQAPDANRIRESSLGTNVQGRRREAFVDS
jgi:hypothetical protein